MQLEVDTQVSRLLRWMEMQQRYREELLAFLELQRRDLEAFQQRYQQQFLEAEEQK